uniref:Uncharacterized protein n=1 Tax=Anguilla anguilla TaxID=7936 RepID=A0A0E9X932_ANGAN
MTEKSKANHLSNSRCECTTLNRSVKASCQSSAIHVTGNVIKNKKTRQF